MADPVEIDPKVRWEIHDDQVRERRKSARRWFLTGLALFIGSFLVGGPDEMFTFESGFFPKIFPIANDAWLQWPQGRAISVAEMDLIAESLFS